MNIETTNVGGQAINFRRRGLEAYGNSATNVGFSLYNSATFRDGEMVKNVNVDGAIDTYFRDSVGDDVAFAMKKIGNAWLVYAVQIGDAMRVGALNNYSTGVIVASLIGLVCVGFAVFGLVVAAVFWLLGIPLTLAFAVLAYICFSNAWGLWSVTRAASALRRPGAKLI